MGHRPGHEQPEIGEVPAVQRNLLQSLARDHVADGGRGAIDERHFRADDDGLPRVANTRRKLRTSVRPTSTFSASMISVRNPGRLRRDRVRSQREWQRRSNAPRNPREPTHRNRWTRPVRG